MVALGPLAELKANRTLSLSCHYQSVKTAAKCIVYNFNSAEIDSAILHVKSLITNISLEKKPHKTQQSCKNPGRL